MTTRTHNQGEAFAHFVEMLKVFHYLRTQGYALKGGGVYQVRTLDGRPCKPVYRFTQRDGVEMYRMYASGEESPF